METQRFLLSGSGGQGVISLAILLADAAAIYGGHNAVQSQSYGPEARGGATRSAVIVCDGPIYYPKVNQPNYLVALTNEAMSKYLPLIRPGGMVLYDSDLVSVDPRVDALRKPLPMYKAVMDALGKPQALNVVVLGALITLTNAITVQAAESVLKARFPPSFFENNQKALHIGIEMAKPVADSLTD